jgi:hypothetical protein
MSITFGSQVRAFYRFRARLSTRKPRLPAVQARPIQIQLEVISDLRAEPSFELTRRRDLAEGPLGPAAVLVKYYRICRLPLLAPTRYNIGN